MIVHFVNIDLHGSLQKVSDKQQRIAGPKHFFLNIFRIDKTFWEGQMDTARVLLHILQFYWAETG